MCSMRASLSGMSCASAKMVICGAHSVAVVGEIDQLAELLPVVGPRLDALALPAGERHGSNLAAIPSGLIAHHRQHAVIVEPAAREKREVGFQPRPIVLAAPQGGEIGGPEAEERPSSSTRQ